MIHGKNKMINREWHEKHKMPMPSTLQQRVEWHISHLKHCACRTDVPPTIAAAMKAQGKVVCVLGHVYDIPGSCPICKENA